MCLACNSLQCTNGSTSPQGTLVVSGGQPQYTQPGSLRLALKSHAEVHTSESSSRSSLCRSSRGQLWSVSQAVGVHSCSGATGSCSRSLLCTPSAGKL